jgi:hypothetical protein
MQARWPDAITGEEPLVPELRLQQRQARFCPLPKPAPHVGVRLPERQPQLPPQVLRIDEFRPEARSRAVMVVGGQDRRPAAQRRPRPRTRR